MAPLGFPIYTRDKTSPRAFPWIWFIRLAQIFVTIIVLGITAANAASFGNTYYGSNSCSVPGKLAWNIACVRTDLCPTFSSLRPCSYSTGCPYVARFGLLPPVNRSHHPLQDPTMVDLHPARSRCRDVRFLAFRRCHEPPPC